MSSGPGAREPLGLTELAELDAGLPDAAEAARRRAAAEVDSQAAAVLDALAATRAELAALPVPEVPPAVAARWAAALAAQADRSVPAPPPHRHMATCRSAEPASNRRMAPRGHTAGRRLLLAAAAVAVGVAGVGALVSPPADPPVLTVSRVDLVAAGSATVGTMDVGRLADPGRRAGCLAAVAPAAGGEALLGGRRVELDGRPGVLLVLSTGTLGRLRILAVDPDCGPSGGELLAHVVVG
jgi:hypothetical protein